MWAIEEVVDDNCVPYALRRDLRDAELAWAVADRARLWDRWSLRK